MPYQPNYVTRGTNVNFNQSERDDANAEILKQQCIAKGGVWDGKTCVLPKEIEAVQGGVTVNNAANPGANKPNTTGASSPPVDPIHAISRELGLPLDAAADVYLSRQNQSPQKQLVGQTTANLNAQSTVQDRQAQVQRLQQLAQQGLITPQEMQAISGADPDLAQALGAGVAGAIPSLLGGAAAGAVGLGAAAGVASGGLLAVPGAIAGGIIGGAAGILTGFYNGVKGNIKSQQSEQFAADQTALVKGDRYLRALISDTNANPQNAPENIALFYQTLNLIDTAHAKTWRDSQENLNKFLGEDGTAQLAKFEVFDSTMRNYYIAQFEAALASPNPSKLMVTQNDIDNFEVEE